MQPIQPQPVQQNLQQPQLQQPAQPAVDPTAPTPDSTGQAVGAASDLAQTIGQGLQSGDAMSGKDVAGKALASAGKGAAMGATIGSVVPVLGNAVGAVVGGVVGGAAGLIKGKKDQKNAQADDLAAAQQQNMQQLQDLQQPPTAKYGRMRYTGGGKKLPGGVMKPIGYGAFKFEGNKHDEAGMGSDSGIILEKGGKGKPGLEVEDGELQVDVKTKGGEKEYIVSDFIKNPATGNTLAEDLERELKRAKNKKEAAKITARYVRLNEQLRGEEGEPEDIVMEKAQGGRRRQRREYYEQVGQYNRDLEQYEQDKAEFDKEKEEMEKRNEEIRKQNEEKQKEYDDAVAAREKIIAENEKKRQEAAGRGAVQEIDPETGKRIYGSSVVDSSNRAEAIQDFYGRMSAGMENLPEGVEGFDFEPYMTDGELDAAKFDTKEAKSAFRDWYNSLDDDLVTGKIASDNDTRDLIFGDQWNSRDLLQRAPEPPAEADFAPTEEMSFDQTAPEAPDAPDAPPAQFRPRMTGTMLQALGPLAALDSGLSTAKMAPAYAREIRMGRVNLDPERAAAAQQTQAASQGITSAVAGPAALAMQQRNLSAGQQSQRGITDQESRANLQIANREKGINANIRQQNARNAMAASQFNAQAMNQTAARNQATRLAALNQLGKIGTQTLKDYNQQYSNFGSDMMEYGPVAADYYANTYRGNTPFNIGARNINVSQMDPEEVARMYNNRQTQQENADDNSETKARKGRYIKKANKVRRKKRRK